MPKLARLNSIIIAAAAMGVSATPALAQPGDTMGIVVTAPQHADLGDNQRLVQFRDLALNRQSGQTALLRRVGNAIDSLCENSVASADPVGALKCSVVAWNSVNRQLDQLLKR